MKTRPVRLSEIPIREWGEAKGLRLPRAHIQALPAFGGIVKAAGKAPWNLNYHFGEDLKEIPEAPEQMQRFVDHLLNELRWVRLPQPALGPKAAKPLQTVEDRGPVLVAVKFLGEVGAYAKILRKTEVAKTALEKSLALIDQYQLPITTWAVHTLRYGDVLRFEKDFLGAEASFRSVLEMIERKPELRDLEDFAWQHLGKLKFDEGDLEQAEQALRRALELRQRKGLPELLSSTQFALQKLYTKPARQLKGLKKSPGPTKK